MNVGNVKSQGKVVPDYSKRRNLLLIILGLGLSSLLWSAGGRQIIQSGYLQEQGEKRYLRDMLLPAHRGEIKDRNGEPLAVSSPIVSVWVDPRHLPENPKFLTALADLIGVPLGTLTTQLTKNHNKGFVYIKHGLAPEIGEAVMALADRYRLGSIGLKQEYQRYYPNGEVTAHVIGITDSKDKGQEGVERSHDALLAGKPGLRKVIQDGRRRIVEEMDLVSLPEPGRPLVLSLDRRIQFLAYLELKKTVEQNKAVAGTAVVLDAQTSEVLAMVNQPSFNPNDRTKFVPAVMRNRAVIDL